ncbi:MAG: insulinase family protein [Oligoflexia bacterium]|nr:insulinase family protein [Oligoflexia bacterium]
MAGSEPKGPGRLARGFAGLVIGALLVAGCRGDAGLGVRFDLKTHRLANGLAVILVEDPTVPVVSYQTWYRVGSVDEVPGSTGLAHLFEHLMFKGTPKYGPKQFFDQLEAKGAEVNAFTTRDYTVYYESFVPSLLEKVVDMEADRMTQLVLNQETFDRERMVVFEERRMRTDNSPEGKLQEAIWALAYRQHPYRWPVIGLPEDLQAIRLEQLQEFYRTHYQPANAAIVVVGAIDAGRTLRLIREHYEGIPARPRPEREISKEPPQNEERRLVLRDSIASERFVQAYHVTSAEEEDSFALDVLANILFSGTTSRAYHLLVEEKDVAVGVSGGAFTPAHPGLFLISATMKQGVPASEAEKLLEQVIERAQETDATAEELQVAVRQLTVDLVDSVRTPQGLATLIGSVQSILGDPHRYADDLKKYTRVTAADVKRVARKYLVPNNRSVVTLVPEAAQAKSPAVPTVKEGGGR